MNDINSRAGSAIDLKLSNTQTFNRWKKRELVPWKVGDLKVKVSEWEILNFFLGLFKVALQSDEEFYYLEHFVTPKFCLFLLNLIYVCVFYFSSWFISTAAAPELGNSWVMCLWHFSSNWEEESVNVPHYIP